MKTLVSIGIILSIFSKVDAQIQQDKVLHFCAGAVISASTAEVMYKVTENKNQAILIGVGAGILAGATKEIYDKTSGNGYCDVRDFLWTCAGASVSCVKITVRL